MKHLPMILYGCLIATVTIKQFGLISWAVAWIPLYILAAWAIWINLFNYKNR